MRNAAKIKKYLLTQVDENNPVELEKVERYTNLIKIFYALDKEIKAHGTLVETVNASQKFLKPNPAVAEKNKINASLLAIEKSFGFEKKESDELTDDYV
ncbi:P27 family phage terminase small subunit [Staphylococcus sp. NRL 19/737]|nr:P27 family phage terminase small subunit [Staphylococcus sp. NRL 19/737]